VATSVLTLSDGRVTLRPDDTGLARLGTGPLRMPDCMTGWRTWPTTHRREARPRRNALLRTAYLLAGDHHDAEDRVQSALIKVVPKWARINDRPQAYVRGCSRVSQ
jgi:hypothetical protein